MTADAFKTEAQNAVTRLIDNRDKPLYLEVMEIMRDQIEECARIVEWQIKFTKSSDFYLSASSRGVENPFLEALEIALTDIRALSGEDDERRRQVRYLYKL